MRSPRANRSFHTPMSILLLSSVSAATGASQVNEAIGKVGEVIVGGQKFWNNAAGASSHTRVALAFTALAGLALAAAILYNNRGHLKSPWFRRKRKNVLSAVQWRMLFAPDGRFQDGGIKFLKKVRSGGVDPSIRAEVWPFLLGVYDLSSSKEERDAIATENRKEYEELRRQCLLLKQNNQSFNSNGRDGDHGNRDASLTGGIDSPDLVDVVSARESLSSEEKRQHHESPDYYTDTTSHEKPEPEQVIDSSAMPESESSDPDSSKNREVSNTLPVAETGEKGDSDVPSKEGSSTAEVQSGPDPEKVIDSSAMLESESPDSDSSEDPKVSNTFPTGETGKESHPDVPSKEGSSKAEVPYVPEPEKVIDSSAMSESDSSDSDSSNDPEVSNTFPTGETGEESDPDVPSKEGSSKGEVQSGLRNTEDIVTWQRIIRLDAIRANAEWIPYSPNQAEVSNERACRAAEFVGLKDYDHLEPCRIFHASRLVAILEAYALHDPEIGYCQGMSDLLSPIIAVMTEDHEAFWCFVGFMKKARHNFRLDEVGIRRQLNIVSKIIKTKDSHLYKHLEMLQAEDCFFVYRMVVVLFRRELSFEQTLCLWEVIWADQAAIRASVGKSAWNKIRQRAPPTEDLLLYAIAASVLQRRKLIIEKYESMDEILRECNSMAGQLDVWRLLDDAHDLVVTLHDKVETSV